MNALGELTFAQVVYLVVAACIMLGALVAVAVLARDDNR
jgi:hypothetical protein